MLKCYHIYWILLWIYLKFTVLFEPKYVSLDINRWIDLALQRTLNKGLHVACSKKTQSQKQESTKATAYHQLWEHVIQFVISGHRQRWLHALQGKVLPQLVGDLWVIVAVKTAEDEGEAAPATAAPALPGSHGYQPCSSDQVGRIGGSVWTSLRPPPPYSPASIRARCGHKVRVRFRPVLYKYKPLEKLTQNV